MIRLLHLLNVGSSVSARKLGSPSSLQKPHHKRTLRSTKSKAPLFKTNYDPQQQNNKNTHKKTPPKPQKTPTLETVQMGLKHTFATDPQPCRMPKTFFCRHEGKCIAIPAVRTEARKDRVHPRGSRSKGQRRLKFGAQNGWLSSCPCTPSCPEL